MSRKTDPDKRINKLKKIILMQHHRLQLTDQIMQRLLKSEHVKEITNVVMEVLNVQPEAVQERIDDIKRIEQIWSDHSDPLV
jgi:phenylpyruvate tautomerase PptA (4-oxalocrotonate tautomerase family)